MESPKTIDLDQLNPTERAAMLLSTAYTDFKSILTGHPEYAMTMHPAILLEMGRLGFHEIEPCESPFSTNWRIHPSTQFNLLYPTSTALLIHFT
jgi:hypothetical protein